MLCDELVNLVSGFGLVFVIMCMMFLEHCCTVTRSIYHLLVKKRKRKRGMVGGSEMGEGEGNILFNDTLNTSYLCFMVKEHSNIQRGNLQLPLHGILFPISSKGSFIRIIPQIGWYTRCLCCTSRGALAGTRKSSMGSSWVVLQM